MTRRELNIAIFEGKAEGVLWQPRLEEWIGYHRKHKTLPERFQDMDDLVIYDNLGCSIRYSATAGLKQYYEPSDVECEEKKIDEEHRISTIRIPEGELRTVYHEIYKDGILENSRIAGFPVKTTSDLRVLTSLINRQHFQADIEEFIRAVDKTANRAEPKLFLNGSGLTDLIKFHCGLLDTYYLLTDHQSAVEEYLEACNRRDDRQLEAALKLPCRIFNLGDHATNEFTPPPILKRYLLPRWQKISARIKKEKRFVDSHWDGNSRLILPFLQETGLNGVEALTPKPMGDITLEEIKEAVKENIVVSDLIPAIFFLPNYSVKEVVEYASRVIDMFAPRLILGVADELSPVGQIEKIEAISELLNKTCGLAT